MSPENPLPDAEIQAIGEAVGLRDLRVLAVGGDHCMLQAPDRDVLVRVPLQSASGSELRREAALLTRVSGAVTVPVPVPLLVLDDPPCMVMSRLPGRSVMDLSSTRVVDEQLASVIGRTVGRTLGALHGSAPEDFAGLVETDAYTPADWHAETVDAARALRDVLPAERQELLERFLAAPVPSPAPDMVVSHNDLGGEHVLVYVPGGRAPRVTGIIDWADTAVTDPAHDFGLLLRDLGTTALDAAMAVYRTHVDPAPGLADRAAFYSVCTLVEDLLFGLDEDRPAYTSKSLRAWDRVLHGALGDR